MARNSYGAVNIGGKHIEIVGVAGKVYGVSKSSETYVEVDHDRGSTSRSTYSYTEFGLDAGDETYNVSVSSHQARVRDGDTATALWGEVGGKSGGWLAVYNHDLDDLKFVAQSRNDLAGPLPYNWIIIVCVIFVVAGAGRLLVGAGGAGSVFMLIAGIGAFYWIMQRRKKLVGFVESAVAGLRARGAVAST